MRCRIPLSLCLALIAGAVPTLARSATPDKDAAGSALLLKPLTLQKLGDLDFGTVVAQSAGTVVINPITGVLTTTGGVTFAGGAPQAARFAGAASKKSVVIIRIPKQPVTLTRVGGTETMTVSNWTLDGSDKKAMAAASSFEFRVGATLGVAANQVDGTYVGTFNVSVQYP